jgi:RNA polymerase sigma-70 factor (ECF subfamily)
VPDAVHAAGARELVNRLLDSLSPEDRLVIRMLEIEECSVEEVRQATGWSSTLIRVRAFRARQKLNKRFGKLRKEGTL